MGANKSGKKSLYKQTTAVDLTEVGENVEEDGEFLLYYRDFQVFQTPPIIYVMFVTRRKFSKWKIENFNLINLFHNLN